MSRSQPSGRALAGALASIWALFAGSGCAHSPNSGVSVVPRILTRNLQARRPPVAGVRPAAEPWDADFRRQPAPDARYDCQPLAEIFRSSGIDAAQAWACLEAPVADGVNVLTFRLKRDVQPFWELEDAEEAPACWRTSLARLPVPREILFQREDGDRGCFSARIDVDADRVLGVRVPTRRLTLQLELPARDLPPARAGEDARARLARYLGGLALTAYWDRERGGIAALPVPRSFCLACMGGERAFVRPVLPGEPAAAPPADAWPPPPMAEPSPSPSAAPAPASG